MDAQFKFPRNHIVAKLKDAVLNIFRIASRADVIYEGLCVLPFGILLVAKEHQTFTLRLTENIVNVNAYKHLDFLRVLKLVSQLEIAR